MMSRGISYNASLLRRVHEFLFALTTAFAAVSIVFIVSPDSSSPFIKMEVSMNRFLHIRQTDLITGYFEFSIPSVLLAVCLWGLLRMFAEKKATNELLRWAGIVVLFTFPIFWFCVGRRSFGWPYGLWPMEFALALLIAFLFLHRTQSFPTWAGMLLIAGHYAFWFWIGGTYQLANYAGPIAPILAFFATLVWAAYASRLNMSTVS